MNEIEIEVDKELEEKKLKAVEGYDEKPKFEKAELLGIKFVTTEKGADLLNEISRIFELVDVPQKSDNVEVMNAEYDIQKTEYSMQSAEEIENLNFLDGVLLTWNIFNKILDKRLRDENGDPEKGICNGHSYDYLGIINDDINDLILNEVLELGYFKHRGEHLHELFEIRSSAYIRPAWMRDKNCIDTINAGNCAGKMA